MGAHSRKGTLAHWRQIESGRRGEGSLFCVGGKLFQCTSSKTGLAVGLEVPLNPLVRAPKIPRSRKRGGLVAPIGPDQVKRGRVGTNQAALNALGKAQAEKRGGGGVK